MDRTIAAAGLMACAAAGIAAGCGSRAQGFTSSTGGGEADTDAGPSSRAPDASEPAPVDDAGQSGFHQTAINAAATTCGLGSAGSFATNQDLNLFGQIVYYEDGGALPPGHYEAKYLGGCMKYDFLFNWQVQASWADAGGGGFWFVGDTSNDRIVMAPGVTMSFADFDACVAANLTAPPEDFEFDGGKLGVWLNDNPYSDNVAGGDGGNPSWQLTLLGSCPPDIVPQ